MYIIRTWVNRSCLGSAMQAKVVKFGIQGAIQEEKAQRREREEAAGAGWSKWKGERSAK